MFIITNKMPTPIVRVDLNQEAIREGSQLKILKRCQWTLDLWFMFRFNLGSSLLYQSTVRGINIRANPTLLS